MCAIILREGKKKCSVLRYLRGESWCFKTTRITNWSFNVTEKLDIFFFVELCNKNEWIQIDFENGLNCMEFLQYFHINCGEIVVWNGSVCFQMKNKNKSVMFLCDIRRMSEILQTKTNKHKIYLFPSFCRIEEFPKGMVCLVHIWTGGLVSQIAFAIFAVKKFSDKSVSSFSNWLKCECASECCLLFRFFLTIILDFFF